MSSQWMWEGVQGKSVHGRTRSRSYGFDRTGEGGSVATMPERMVEASGGDCHLCPWSDLKSPERPPLLSEAASLDLP